jgi:hypothetical protein
MSLLAKGEKKLGKEKGKKKEQKVSPVDARCHGVQV